MQKLRKHRHTVRWSQYWQVWRMR